MAVLESSLRPLTAAERRLLQLKIRDLESRLRRGPRTFVPAVIIILILWALTLALSDATWPVVTAFWVVIGGGLTLWVQRDLRKDLGTFSAMQLGYESARQRNEAEVFDIKASSFVEFEEVEDEGACYAFAIGGDRVAFVVGQQFYAEARFPSLDFSLVHPLSEAGEVVDVLIEKRGPKAAPERIVPAKVKLELAIPEHLEVVNGRLDEIEELLRPPAGTEQVG